MPHIQLLVLLDTLVDLVWFVALAVALLQDLSQLDHTAISSDLPDNAPCHPPYLNDVHPNVKIIFLPPNTTPLVQPLDQEVIANVKNFYHTRLYDYLREKTETNEEMRMIEAEDLYGNLDVDSTLPETQDDDLPDEGPVTPELTVRQFWKQFTIRDAVGFLLQSWGDINEATITHAWRSLVPHLVPKEAGSQVQLVADSERAALAAAQTVAGCKDVTAEEMREVLAPVEETAQTAMQRIDEEDQLASEQEINPQTVQEGEQPAMTMRNLANILSVVDTLKDAISNNDPDSMRVEEIISSIDRSIRFYAEKHHEGVNKRTQALITQFIRANPGPSTSISDGDGDDRDDTISEDDFEGFLNEVGVHAAHNVVSSDSESDDVGPQ